MPVPASWDRLDAGDPITMYVVRVPSLAADPAPDPVVFLIGGPGFGASRAWRGALEHPWWLAIRARRDVILVDERGSGRSTPPVCPEEEAALRQLPPAGLDDEARRAAMRRLFTDCAARLQAQGRGFDTYRSRHVGRDLAALRGALGLERWNLFGLSYGARQVLAAMEADPAGTRAVLLGSPAMPNAPTFATAAAFDDSLAYVLRQCASDAACAAESPDLTTRLREGFDALAAAPWIVDGLDPAIYSNGRLVVTRELAAQSIGLMLYDRQLSGAIPLLAGALERRDVHVARSIGGALAGASAANQLIGIGVPCVEARPHIDPAALAADRARPGLVGTGAASQDAEHDVVCAAVPSPPPDPADASVVDHGVPILALVGAFDPITPAARVRAAIAALPSARVVELPGESHRFFLARAEGCARELASAFLDDPAAPTDARCTAAMPPIRFATGLHPTGVPGARVGALAQQPGWLAAAGLVVLLLLSAPVVAAAAAWRQRRATERAIASNGLLATTGIASLVLLAVLAAALMPVLRESPFALGFGVPVQVASWLGLAWPIAACGIAAALAGVLASRRGLHSRASMVYRILVGLSALSLGAFLGTMGLP